MGRQAAEGLEVGPDLNTALNADCGCQREDIENVDVVVFPFGPPVSQVQKLLGKECTEWAVSDMVIGDAQGQPRQNTSGNAREQ